MTLTKADLATLLAQQIGLSRRESKDMVDAFFDEITAALARGTRVKLTGFGNFSVRRKAQRAARNPRTGEPALVSARYVVTFHVARKVNASVQASQRHRKS